MGVYQFRPSIDVVATFPGHVEIADLEREVGMYSATPDFVRRRGGPIARSILDLVPDWYYRESEELGLYPNCDVRIHRLYPGDLPAYPGWHCDGEFRETYFSQPDLDRTKVHKHLIATVSSHKLGVSNPEFLAEPFDFDSNLVDAGHGLWQQVNDAIETIEREGRRYLRRAVYDGSMVCFDSWTLHRVRPATVRGWRLFFRMAMWHRPNLGEGGMLTRQEQVYKLVGHNGW